MMRVPGSADGLLPSPLPGLQRLPYEIVSNIALSLTLDSIFDLALCSRHFQYVIRENNFCRIIVMVSIRVLTRPVVAVQNPRRQGRPT